MISNTEDQMENQVNKGLTKDSFVLRALVVDDDFTTVKITCHMLNAIGCRTDSANCGEAAMQCLKKSWYDFVLTDLNMPDINGCEIAKWLKRYAKHTKVIIMTSCNPTSIFKYKDNDIPDFWLFKPFSLNMLTDALRDLDNVDI